MPDLDTYATNRLIVYLVISLLTALSSQLYLVDSGELILDSVASWGIFFTQIILQPIIVLRSFMDQSLSKKKDE